MEPTVLVVDDDDAARRHLAEYVAARSRSSRVIEARDGAYALHEVRSRKYDLVVLDLMMPYMSGVDFLVSLAALKSDPSFETIDPPNVIVITGAAEIPSGELEHRFPKIVRCVHRKPLDLDELARCIQEALSA